MEEHFVAAAKQLEGDVGNEEAILELRAQRHRYLQTFLGSGFAGRILLGGAFGIKSIDAETREKILSVPEARRSTAAREALANFDKASLLIRKICSIYNAACGDSLCASQFFPRWAALAGDRYL